MYLYYFYVNLQANGLVQYDINNGIKVAAGINYPLLLQTEVAIGRN